MNMLAKPVAPSQEGAYPAYESVPKRCGMDPRLRGGDEGPAILIAGYAARFGALDRGGDVVAPGAFAASLCANRTLPLLWQHDPTRRIGEAVQLAEDRYGLRLIGRIDDHGAAALVSSGAMRGLSFGYRVRRSEGASPRLLHELDLVEISLVAMPMQTLARVHLVISLPIGSTSQTLV